MSCSSEFIHKRTFSYESGFLLAKTIIPQTERRSELQMRMREPGGCHANTAVPLHEMLHASLRINAILPCHGMALER